MTWLFGNQKVNESDFAPLRKYLTSVRRLIMHAVIAGVGCMILGAVFLSALHVRARGPRYFTILFLTDAPYSPAFWGSALVVGFALNRVWRDRLAYWLGPIALLGFILLIVASLWGYERSHYEIAISGHSFLRYTWGELFSIDPNKCPGDECLGHLLFTAPVLNCVVYSIGARLGMRWSTNQTKLQNRGQAPDA